MGIGAPPGKGTVGWPGNGDPAHARIDAQQGRSVQVDKVCSYVLMYAVSLFVSTVIIMHCN